MRGGDWCSGHFESGRERAPRGGTRAHEAAVATPASRPGEEDDRAGRAGWAGQRLNPSGGWWQRPKRRGKESGPAGVEGEAGRGWAEFGAGQEFKKNSF
jgi:hypothetical protein